jgi:hypothetical protein
VAITLDPDEVRSATAALMAYRLRSDGFAAGQGGVQQTDFTDRTTPTLAQATEVTTRNAALVSDDFPGAEEGDRPELVTIAALRSAVELEASAPSMDAERIRVWREQLREYVTRAGERTAAGSSSEAEPGARVLAALWSFGPSETLRVPGAEVAQTATGELLYDGGEPVAPAQRRRLLW